MQCKIELTKREQDFCEFLHGREFYIARDLKGELELYYKCSSGIETIGYFISNKNGDYICSLDRFDLKFSFLKNGETMAIDEIYKPEDKYMGEIEC